jgi:hypothetical protein
MASSYWAVLAEAKSASTAIAKNDLLSLPAGLRSCGGHS